MDAHNIPITDLFDASEICKAIYNYSAEAIVIVDDRGKIVHANPIALKVFQYSLSELTGQSIEFLIPKEYRKNHHNHVSNYQQDAHPRSMGSGLELYALRKDESKFAVSISLSPATIRDRTYTVALVIDITEQKDAKEKLRKHNQELENRVNERTKELAQLVNNLERANKELRQAEEEVRVALTKEKELNELKSRFVSMASHEFRTPLSTILTSLTLLEKYTEKTNQEKGDKHFGRIRSNVKHLTNLLNDFLSIDKLQEGKTELNLVDVDIVELLTDLREELEQFKKSEQIIHLDIPHSLTMHSDSNILKNILLNLGSNAIKYSPDGKTIYLKVWTDSNDVFFEVKDEGIGIPEEDQVHLFERFFRAANSTNITGTGLGLNIVKHYVELLSGTISFSSIYQKGSTFTITFSLN